MDYSKIWEELAIDGGGKIIYVILDGVGGMQDPKKGLTELEAAHTPHLDELAKESSTGMLDIIGPGITPGSGPGHLSLFGYDPLAHNIGRGVFSALGIDFNLQAGDVAARMNFATLDETGKIQDRRAGRIETSVNEYLCEKIRQNLDLDDIDYFLRTVSEHRAVLILRGKGLYGSIKDTDPQEEGLKPLDPIPLDDRSWETARIVKTFIDQVRDILTDEEPANMILMRGFDTFHRVPSLKERFKLKGLCIADYPMYRGVSRFLGLEALPPPGGIENEFNCLADHYGPSHDFYFLHIKHTDKAGEDGDFDKKVGCIEEIDRYIPLVLKLNPDVLVVTGDHSTPAAMAKHSWHSVPFLIRAKTARIDPVDRFNELSCLHGSLGQRKALDLIGLALAHAGRLKKFGA